MTASSLEQPVRTRLVLFVVLHNQSQLRVCIIKVHDAEMVPFFQVATACFTCCPLHLKFSRIKRLKPLLPQGSTVKIHDRAGVALVFHALLWRVDITGKDYVAICHLCSYDVLRSPSKLTLNLKQSRALNSGHDVQKTRPLCKSST